MKKIVLSLFITISLFLQMSGIVTFAENIQLERENNFEIIIHSEFSNLDLSGITIDVYAAEVSYSDISTGYIEYDEEYSFSVETGTDGKASFNRPSEAFSITVCLDTLPSNLGIDHHTQFITSQTNVYEATLFEVENIDIERDSGEIAPCFFDKNGNVVYADAEVTLIQNNEETLHSINANKKQISYNETVVVSYQDSQHTITDNIVYKYTDNYDKIGYLLANKLISEDDYFELLSQYILDDSLLSSISNSLDGTELYWKMMNYSNKLNTKMTVNMQKAIEKLSVSNLSEASLYQSSDNGHFRVYYDSSESTAAIAKAVANEFQAVDSLFCTSWGFRQPYYNTSTSYYKIYLVDTTSYSGSTPLVGSQGSYINISCDTAEHIYNDTGISGYPDAYKGVVAHEYMHAIFYRYGILYNTSERQWMHESFASWAGIAYESDYSAFRTSAVKQFLSSTWQSLDYFTDGGSYDLRHYGSCVFPLYIQQQMGGYNTIKRILLSYSSSNSPFTAINTGLQYYGYSLSSAYAGCASYNYDATYFYSNTPDSGYYAWGSGDVYEFNTYPVSSSVTHGVQGLACHYTQFNAPVNTNSTLTITVDYSGITGGAEAVLKTIRKTESGDNYINNRTISSNRCTIVQNNFGHYIAKSITIVPINAANSGHVSYTRTATLIYTPADDAIYRLRNVGSGKYLNVHNGVDANTTNVYQWTADGTVEQNFRLEEKINGKYHIRAMCSSDGYNRVLDIVKSGGVVASGCNVEIYNPTDPVAQEWLFYDMGNGRYKIVPASNTSVALTSYGTSNGTSSGQTSTSAGNVFVQTYTGSLNQLWVFEPIP